MFRFLLIPMLMLLTAGGICSANTPPPQKTTRPAAASIQRVLPVHEHKASCEMTVAEPVQIICILDRSGSMRSLASDTIGGYNSFLEKQKRESGRAEVTTVLFDDKYEKIAEGIDIQKAPELTSAEYYARGTTALLDAVGRTIMDTAGRMEKEGVCPEKRRVLFLIMTDGLENASKEYDKASVKAMIDSATNDYKWSFIFMGANIDSVAEAAKLGISSRHAMNYAPSKAGIRKSFDRMGAAASEVRESGSVSEEWKDGESKP